MKTASNWRDLPPARTRGGQQLSAALSRRRSVREFRERALTLDELSQLVWAAQGVSNEEGDRTAPSAGGLRPLELWVATAEGFFHYDPEGHRLGRRSTEDLRRVIYDSALEQEMILKAPAVFVFAAVFGRTVRKYGKADAFRYVHLEAGHAAQNLLLQAVALGLGGVAIGSFWKARLRKGLGLPAKHEPVYIVAVGAPA